MIITVGSGKRRVSVQVPANRAVPAKPDKPGFVIVDAVRRSAFGQIADALFGEKGSKRRNNAFHRGQRLALA